jgi:hypothetical protein
MRAASVARRYLEPPAPVAAVEMMYRPDRSEVVERSIRVARDVLQTAGG